MVYLYNAREMHTAHTRISRSRCVYTVPRWANQKQNADPTRNSFTVRTVRLLMDMLCRVWFRSMTICDDDDEDVCDIYRAIASASYEEHASRGALHMRVRVCACECACVAFGRPPTELSVA